MRAFSHSPDVNEKADEDDLEREVAAEFLERRAD